MYSQEDKISKNQARQIIFQEWGVPNVDAKTVNYLFPYSIHEKTCVQVYPNERIKEIGIQLNVQEKAKKIFETKSETEKKSLKKAFYAELDNLVVGGEAISA
jgi:hypothetical protein